MALVPDLSTLYPYHPFLSAAANTSTDPPFFSSYKNLPRVKTRASVTKKEGSQLGVGTSLASKASFSF